MLDCEMPRVLITTRALRDRIWDRCCALHRDPPEGLAFLVTTVNTMVLFCQINDMSLVEANETLEPRKTEAGAPSVSGMALDFSKIGLAARCARAYNDLLTNDLQPKRQRMPVGRAYWVRRVTL